MTWLLGIAKTAGNWLWAALGIALALLIVVGTLFTFNAGKNKAAVQGLKRKVENAKIRRQVDATVIRADERAVDDGLRDYYRD